MRLHAKGDLRVEDIATPEAPQSGWVQIAVSAAGICGSDLHNFATGQWITRAPSVAGHEFMGTVTSLGTQVEGLNIGDRAVHRTEGAPEQTGPGIEKAVSDIEAGLADSADDATDGVWIRVNGRRCWRSTRDSAKHALIRRRAWVAGHRSVRMAQVLE